MDLSEEIMGLLKQHHVETFAHCVRVEHLCEKLGAFVGLSTTELGRLCLAGKLHDIGKIAVPVEILSSPNALDDAGRGEIERHPRVSSLVASILGRDDVALLVIAHHEPGYPRESVREPEEASQLRMLLRLTDQFDALATARSYKPALDSRTVRSTLLDHGFEGRLVDFLIGETQAN